MAVGGIIMLHFIEHLNFYSFPPLTKFDEAVWDVAFFVLSNKMYAIFAMLFGLTLFVQHDNQAAARLRLPSALRVAHGAALRLRPA